MKQLAPLRWGALFVGAVLSCLPALAAPPDVERGVAWLAAQPQADGRLASEHASVALAVQARAETLVTLKRLSTAPVALGDVVAQDAATATELLARRVAALAQAGRSTGALVAKLMGRQNADGAAVGQPYQYLVAASDPDGDPLTYALAAAPAGMTISASGLVAWNAPVQGAHTVTVRVSDGKLSTDQSFVVTVGQTLLLRLSLSVLPQFVNAGDTVTISVGTTGGRGTVAKTLTVDGATVALDASGQARVTAIGVGTHRVVASANDGTETLTESSFFGVADPQDTTAPVAVIDSPSIDTEITKPVDIVGTASDARLAEYVLSITPAGQAKYTTLARGTTSKTNEVLGRLDPTLLANGIYQVRLDVYDANGRVQSDAMTYEVTENLKVGHFSVSFLDLSVEASGIPIQVTRTYDTRRKGESLDFGHGWTVDYQNVRLQKNVSTGASWAIITEPLRLCIRPTGKRKVNVTLPDGRVERFEAGLKTECGGIGQLPPIDVVFKPIGNTTGTLEAMDLPGLLSRGENLVDDSTFEIWNPKKFKLTTLERFVYELDQDFGIRKVTEPNGNTLTYSAAGIVHSNGQSVSFVRDAAGRIAQVTDPSGRRLNYVYDGDANLTSVIDRSGLESVLKYDRVHTLTHYTDPRGVQLVRNEYDPDGRLVAQFDAAGNKIDLAARALAANTEVVKNRRGGVTTYEYDNLGNVTKVIDANGKSTFYTYDGRGNEATVKDPLGRITERVFDEMDNPKKDAGGNKTLYDWKPRSRDLAKLTDARGNATVMDYGVTGNLGTITDAEGAITALGYDAKGNLASLKDGAGNETLYVYDDKGRRTRETDPTGAVTNFEYDSNGNQTRVTRTRVVNGEQRTLVTDRTFDADGNTTSEVVKATKADGTALAETGANGLLSVTEWNALKKVASQKDAAGRVTRFDYEVRGYETRVTHPDGLFEEKTYDPNGNEATTTDRAGRVTTKTYDALDRLTRVTYPDGRFTENGYDDAGRLTSVTDERGNTTTHGYDLAGRRTRTSDPLTGTWLYTYDANGNLTSSEDPRNNKTLHEYDKANRRVKTTYPAPQGVAAQFETWTYDGAGRRVSWTDTAGKTTRYGYDKAGRLTSVTQPHPTSADPAVVGPVTKYGYDERGNKVSQTDALNRVTTWEYDELGRVTRRTLPKAETETTAAFETFTYDAVGNVATHTTFRNEVISFAYDALNRLSAKTLPGNNVVSYTYTPTGQVATVADARGVTRYAYDLRDRVTRMEQPEGWVITYTYDAAGNRETVSTQFGAEPAKVTAYEYDKANRVSKVTAADGRIWSFTYDLAGNRKTVVQPNGLTALYTYDERNRLSALEHRRPVTLQATLVKYDYTWNAQGLRGSVTSNHLTEGQCTTTYSYDALGRLVQSSGAPGCARSGATAFTYDDVGNRLSLVTTPTTPLADRTYEYDARDRLVKVTPISRFPSQDVTPTTYQYDAAGNLTQETAPKLTVDGIEQVTEYRWDAEGRMVGMTNPYFQRHAMHYDADGQLVRQAEDTDPVPAKVAHFAVDKNLPYAQILEERDGAATLVASYVFDGTQVIGQVRGAQSSVYHPDHLSARILTDAAGTIQASYSYSPFGELTREWGATIGSAASVGNPHRFAGERLDAASGFYYLRARYLDPRLGRFGSTDPHPGAMRNPMSLNDYVYAADNPINRYDPNGRFSLMMVSTVGVGLTSAALTGYSIGTDLSEGNYLGAFTEVALAGLGVGLIKRLFDGKYVKFIAGPAMAKIRQIYIAQVKQMGETEALMRAAGRNSEQVARAMVQLRNEAKAETRALMGQEGVVGKLMAKFLEVRNVNTYWNPLGPSADTLFLKYNKNWEEVIAASRRLSDEFSLIVH